MTSTYLRIVVYCYSSSWIKSISIDRIEKGRGWSPSMLTIAIDQSLLSWLNLSLIKQGRTVKTTLYNICIQWLIRQHSTNIPPLDNMYTLWSSIEHASISGVLNIINWPQDEREIHEWCSIDIKLYERLTGSKNVTTHSYIKWSRR